MAKIYITTDDGEVMDTIHVDTKTGWGNDVVRATPRLLDALDRAIQKDSLRG